MAITFDDLEPGDFQPTSIDGGLPKLVRIWEHLRDLNTGGYGGAVLVDVKNATSKGKSGVTSCSPFTATCIYMALDPRPFDAGTPWLPKEPYEPVFDGGKPLDANFYRLHNGFGLTTYASLKDNKFAAWKADFKKRFVDHVPQLARDFSAFQFINHSAGSVIAFNLGKRVDPKKMRRGDVVGIDWHNGHGHATFCWNVHLNAKGEVDCFQFISSNGTAAGGAGITIFRYPDVDPAYLERSGGKYKKKKDMFSGIIEDPRAYPEYVQKPYWWFGLPGVKKGEIDLDSFGVPAKSVQISYADSMDVSVSIVHVSRLHGITPPEPYLRADGGKTPEPKEDSKPAPLAKAQAKKADAAPQGAAAQGAVEKAAPAPPHPVQEELEGHLQTLWKARWISKDPGDPGSVNDPESQAAIRNYQETFMKGDVPQLGHADPKTRGRIAKAAASAAAMPMVCAALHLAHEHGEIQSAPGADPILDDATRAAVKEFQGKQKGLDVDGIPGHDTQEKLSAFMKSAAKSAPPKKPQQEPAQQPAEQQPAQRQGAKSKTPEGLPIWYFPRNHGPKGKPVTVSVKVLPADAFNGKSYSVTLLSKDGKELAKDAGTITIKDGKGSVDIPLPASAGPGSILKAKVSGNGTTVEVWGEYTVRAALVPLPFLLAGPIVRRAEPKQVWFWFATSEQVTGCTPELVQYVEKGVFVQAQVSLAPAERHTVRLGERLWVTLVAAKPREGTFPNDAMLGYDLEIVSPAQTVKLSKLGLQLAYSPFKHPTFMLAAANQRLAHGSCRRPGAGGEDAFIVFDEWLASTITSAKDRPAALLLTGDQIYADDVQESLFLAVQKIAADVFGYVERLPKDGAAPVPVDQFPGIYPADHATGMMKPDEVPDFAAQGRKGLTSIGHSPIGFTTEDGEGHLLSFGEYAAMYLAVWNEQLCANAKYKVDIAGPHGDYSKIVATARRVLANMATYMVLDDHEITDDWNLDEEWQTKTRRSAMARRIIANGLAAAWAFQTWGNDPAAFDSGFAETIQTHLGQLGDGNGSPGGAADSFEKMMLDRRWSFVAPTSPPALCVDTRTGREFPPGKTAVLSGKKIWPDLTALAKRHNLRKGDPLLIVLPTPLLPHYSMVWVQHDQIPWPAERYNGDYELYANNPRQRTELILFLHDLLAPPWLAIFSGDVHHGSVIDGIYGHAILPDLVDAGHADWVMRVVQITSSPIKNVKENAYTKWFWIKGVLPTGTDPGNLGETVLNQNEYESELFTQADLDQLGLQRANVGAVVMRAYPAHLYGPLGRETFVYENHLCVCDVPDEVSLHVKVQFIGAAWKAGTLAISKCEVDTMHDPGLFSRFVEHATEHPGLLDGVKDVFKGIITIV